MMLMLYPQGLAGHSIDVYLCEIFGVHGEVVPIQSDMEPEVQLVLSYKGWLRNRANWAESAEGNAKNNKRSLRFFMRR